MKRALNYEELNRLTAEFAKCSQDVLEALAVHGNTAEVIRAAEAVLSTRKAAKVEEASELAEGMRNVLSGYAKGNRDAVAVLTSHEISWRSLAARELETRAASRVLGCFGEEELAAIANGSVNFSALCREVVNA